MKYDSWGTQVDHFERDCVAIGIDFGTSNSCVGVWNKEKHRVKIMKHKKARTLGSVVRYDSSSSAHVTIGEEATTNVEPYQNTIQCVKRLLGLDYEKFSDLDLVLPCKVVELKGDRLAYEIIRDGKTVQVEVETVAADILKRLKSVAENCLQSTIYNAVITVPAYFNDRQRKAVLRAANLAGFRGVRLLNEPTAAAMAYGLFVAGSKTVLVFDFGGGTLDISVMKIDEGTFQVLAIVGDSKLGGEDLTNLVYSHVLSVLDSAHGILRLDISMENQIALWAAVEEAKKKLTAQAKVEIVVADIGEHNVHFRYELTREKFEEIGSSVWDRCMALLENVLIDADIDKGKMDEVILVGGSSQIPILREKISNFFDGKELCQSINVDQVVCEGAAIQAAILSGMDRRVMQDVLMLDVIPLSIGLETADGRMQILLPKNTSIPISITKNFETFEDDQKGISVDAFEGESLIAQENERICRFNFPIAKEKRGKKGKILHPVTFTMNANGVLQVTAGIFHDSEDARMSKSGILAMSSYIVFLFSLYLFARLYFAGKRIKDEL